MQHLISTWFKPSDICSAHGALFKSLDTIPVEYMPLRRTHAYVIPILIFVFFYTQPKGLIALCKDHKVLTQAHIADGFKGCVEFMEDVKIDIPKCPEYLRNMIGAIVVS